MHSPCCRLINLIDHDKIQLMVNGAGQDGMFRSNAEEDIRNGTNFGWDMTNSEDGYPCEKLTSGGCSIYSDRPSKCRNFPNSPALLKKLPNCTIYFDDNGNHVGTCNGCQS